VFLPRGAMLGYDVVLFIIALAKTMTPLWEPTATAVAAGRQSLTAFFIALLSCRPKAIAYTDLLC
jgi:hypothetical protein